MRGEVVEQLGRARAREAFGLAAVGVELQMGEVRLPAVERAHRLQGRARVAGDAEVVGVHVHGMRQAERVDGGADRLDDLARRDLEAGDRARRATRSARCSCFHSSTPPGLTSLTP